VVLREEERRFLPGCPRQGCQAYEAEIASLNAQIEQWKALTPAEAWKEVEAHTKLLKTSTDRFNEEIARRERAISEQKEQYNLEHEQLAKVLQLESIEITARIQAILQSKAQRGEVIDWKHLIEILRDPTQEVKLFPGAVFDLFAWGGNPGRLNSHPTTQLACFRS